MDASFLEALKSYQPTIKTETDIAAAVMVLIIEKQQNEFFLLITKRPDSIATYAGDYCFPGGTREKSDKDLRQTAERELEEELSLQPSDYAYIATLDDTVDRYGNVVRPFVAKISSEHFEKTYRLAHDEIESIYLLPIDDIKEFKRDHRLENLIARTPVYSYRHDNVFIWGLTARIIVRLSEIIF